MVYAYTKKDKEKKHPIPLNEAVRYKSLWNKALKIETELRNYFDERTNIMFEFEDEETKRELWKAIDCLKRFRDNLKIKSKYVEE